MIDPKELRIGNIVAIAIVDEPVKIKAVIPEQEYYVGIPLTEEWLVKAGFTPVPTPAAWDDCNKAFDKGVFRGGLMKGTKKYIMFDFKINGYYKEIDYVHQLQNIYFALTGQELDFSGK